MTDKMDPEVLDDLVHALLDAVQAPPDVVEGFQSPFILSTDDDDGLEHVVVYAWGDDADRVRRAVEHKDPESIRAEFRTEFRR